MAATVEESTPPDMATAMVRADMLMQFSGLRFWLLATSYWPPLSRPRFLDEHNKRSHHSAYAA
jgi:hypothetical protein